MLLSAIVAMMKARRDGKIPVKVSVTRAGKTFQQTVYKNPSEVEESKGKAHKTQAVQSLHEKVGVMNGLGLQLMNLVEKHDLDFTDDEGDLIYGVGEGHSENFVNKHIEGRASLAAINKNTPEVLEKYVDDKITSLKALLKEKQAEVQKKQGGAKAEMLFGEEHLTGTKKPEVKASTGESGKRYEVNYNVGKAKYLVTFFDGIRKNKDGSDAAGIKIFRNKVEFEKYLNDLHKDGYKRNTGLSDKGDTKPEAKTVDTVMPETKTASERDYENQGEREDAERILKQAQRVSGWSNSHEANAKRLAQGVAEVDKSKHINSAHISEGVQYVMHGMDGRQFGVESGKRAKAVYEAAGIPVPKAVTDGIAGKGLLTDPRYAKKK